MTSLSTMTDVERYAAIEAAAWTKVGETPRNVVTEIFPSSASFVNKTDGKAYQLEFAAKLNKSLPIFQSMTDLLRDNMKQPYEMSGWGWNEKKKLRELADEDARFLVLTDPEDGK
jgi:hypothetical protein